MKRKKMYLVIDLIIILLILCFIYGYYKIAKSGISTDVNKILTYRIKVSNVDLEYIEGISEGDILYDDLTNYKIGTVVGMEYDNMYVYSYNEINNTYKKDIIDSKYDLYLDISSGVYDNERNLFINDFDVKIGKEMDLITDDYSVYGFIVDIVGEDDENN